MSGDPASTGDRAYRRRIGRNLLLFTAGFLVFFGGLAYAEQKGFSRTLIGPILLFATVMMYAVVGLFSRTTDTEEYYVAGRRIPAVYNGMATAADWMSAASFISLAGALYLQGYGGTANQTGGLAYVLGWTGGFVLVALLIAPHLRRLELYTLPDFFAVRYGGRWPRLLAAGAVVLCSFPYVVAQIYGVGLIASRLTGVQFEIGILLGLGGVLVCSFLGGMRAVTWTQVAQYIVLLLAFLIPVSWLAYKQLGNPLAPAVYGEQIQKIALIEQLLIHAPAEQEVRAIFEEQARTYRAKLEDVDMALARERELLEERISMLKKQGADFSLVALARRELDALPKDAETARRQWTQAMFESAERAQPLGGLPLHSQAFAGNPNGTAAEAETYNRARLNFVALMFCLMVGTAALPHLLTRFYTTPTVAEARTSVAWSLFFIALLYISAPALAALVKFEVMQGLVGTSFENLPRWIGQWSRVDPGLISVVDINGDRVVQFGEIRLSADMIMLATPELGGLPFVVSGLVAAGGLAAALSTADGLLLTISNAIIRDMAASNGAEPIQKENRVIISKFALLAVAMVAALVAASKPAEILALVTAAFSLAASALFPAMVLGIYWRRASGSAAVAGMAVGLAVTMYYMVSNFGLLGNVLGVEISSGLWFGIHPVSAGVFGVPAGMAVILAISLVEGRFVRRA